MRAVIIAALALSACKEEPRYVPPPAPMPAPVASPEAPMGPVAPGQYTNHIGNPQAGYWDQQGQWQWHNPESKEASSTLGYLAAAGAGAAGGALLSHYFTKKHFEQQNPKGWEPQERTVTTYLDKRGNPISKEEYERRRAQSEQDRKRYQEQKALQQQQYRDKQGRFISKEEYERRQRQSEMDRKRVQERAKPSPAPKPKKLNINRWNKKRRK